MLRLATRHASTNRSILNRIQCHRRFVRLNSSLPSSSVDDDHSEIKAEILRLRHLRNVGILAHVDAGKTTVTERMLALAGVVSEAGSVDDGNTVTDYLPAERERGITIQAAAISFEWGWHNSTTNDDYEANSNVQIHLIDTPGHVDFSVEVNRAVAVLDGAVLVVDAVAGAQAQTETVWRAMTRPSLNNHDPAMKGLVIQQDHAHEPLPCLALINKMDKEGCHFGNAIASLRRKLPGANPIPMQVPLFRTFSKSSLGSQLVGSNIVAIPADTETMITGDFVGVVDLVHMRAIVYPDVSSFNVDDCIPDVINLICSETLQPLDSNCHVTREAVTARQALIESLADIDEAMEEYFLSEQQPSNAQVRAALRRATLARTALPVLAGAALRGRGVEPLLDSIADLLPSPLDRMAPALTKLDSSTWTDGRRKAKKGKKIVRSISDEEESKRKVKIGHPLHPTLLALAFKVVHMKGRGGSGDGRVVFARVYSGELHTGDTLQVISPPAPGEAATKPRIERIGGMLELAGGKFDNIEDGMCASGDVCALVGLKSVVTGDTILLEPKGKVKSKRAAPDEPVCLAGVSSPKPVLKVRLEAESAEMQKRLSAALILLAVEDPSLLVEETESATLLSGLGELHIEVTLDRLYREYGLDITVGKPAVAYRESLLAATLETDGLVEYDRTIGASRMQAAIHLRLESKPHEWETSQSACVFLSDPIVTLGQEARAFLKADSDEDEEELMEYNSVVRALILGCKGALKRGPLGSYAMANMSCHIENIDAEGGLPYLESMPGALRAAASHAISGIFAANKQSCSLLEPTMSVEVTVPGSMVGMVLSDLTGRRGHVGDVIFGDGDDVNSKALVRGEVPLVEILGYANSLRSLTGGEGTFTAEYKGHSPCDDPSMMTR